MQLGTFTADIIIDGEAVEQYDVTSESSTKVTCWIASEEGKPFSVKWTCHEELRVTSSRGSVCVDGTCAGCGIILPGKGLTANTHVFSNFLSFRSKRELMFARVELDDDDSLLGKEIPRNLGEICLIIRRGKVVKEVRVPPNNVPVLGDNKFHERSKKATVHCIGFGPEVPRRVKSHRSRLIPDHNPELTFVFKYQALGMLQANGIAPMPPLNAARASHEIGSAEPDVGTSDGDHSGTPKDIKPAELNWRIQSLENELKRLRDLQGATSEERKSKRIKREEQRRAMFRPGEIIDLT